LEAYCIIIHYSIARREVGWACSTNDNVINVYNNLVGKADGKKVFVGLGWMEI
jgi:hypothetical protein